MINANKIEFRCSQLSLIMVNLSGGGLTEKQAETLKELIDKSEKKALTAKQAEYLQDLIRKRDSPPELGDGVIGHLLDVYLREKYGRKEDITNKFLKKGNEREEDAITLVSRIRKKHYVKNIFRNHNGWVSGEHDLHDEDDLGIQKTLDTKCSWSMHTFLRSKYKDNSFGYTWQGHGYMWLTGAKEHEVCYCLVNGTYDAIMDEKRRLAFNMNLWGNEGIDENEQYVKGCQQIERNHIFNRGEFAAENPGFNWHTPASEWNSDVPLVERMHSFTIERDERKFEFAKERIGLCRIWMNENLFEYEKEASF